MTDEIQGVMEKLASLCKRRGFIFQSSEIYGGFGGFWDYGPLGVELMQNVRNFWWQNMVRGRRDVVGLDSSIISNPEVWVASGHVGHFHDIFVDDKNTKERFRLDQLEYKSDEDAKKAEELAIEHIVVLEKVAVKKDEVRGRNRENPLEFDRAVAGLCRDTVFVEYPDHFDPYHPYGVLLRSFWDSLNKIIGYFPLNPTTGKESRFTEPAQFNLMLETSIGAKQDSSSVAYLRAETCQPIFVDFDTIRVSSRQKIPFGVAQVGKAFRNEINPRNFTFRSREFTQMELEFFIPPDDHRLEGERSEKEWFEYWRDERRRYYEVLGLWNGGRMRIREHTAEELPHYAKYASDFEFQFPFGWAELEGVHHRGDYDLGAHQKHSKKSLAYTDPDRGNAKYLPAVIETSVGLDRTVLALLCAAYHEDKAATKKEGMEEDVRVVLRLPASVAPVQVAVLPLSKKLSEYADKLERELSGHFATEFDVTGSIGRRYRRQDEIGTPYAVTVDFETIEGDDAGKSSIPVKGGMGDLKDTVTIRDRDTLEQVRVHVDALIGWLRERFDFLS